jgi:N-carbamoylputrescine amidase
MSKIIRVAAVQMDCEPGEIVRNLAHAEVLVTRAAGQGAQLVLLPELMPSGYLATEALWDSAESSNGASMLLF